MAATEHSAVLGLSLWEQSDCPEWADFLQDNQKLEQLAGGHIQNSALHLTAEEKQFLAQRRAVLRYTGTGEGDASLSLPFAPQKLTVAAQGRPGLLPRPEGGWDVFSQVWLAGEEGPWGTGGVTVEGLSAAFSEGAFTGQEGLYHALNRAGVTYWVEIEA